MNKQLLIALAICSTLITKAQEKVETDSLENLLNEVVVTANQSATRIKGSKLITTIPGTNLAALGNAYDVLRQLPLIKVNESEQITVTGKGTPEIYIDGRPLRDGEELRSLLSSNIKRVELQLAPGALYDSTTQAVILITTRRNFIKGVSLTNYAEAKASRVLSANDALNFSYHGTNYEIFGTGLFAHNNSRIKGHTINRFEYNGKTMIIGSSQDNTYPGKNASGKLGFNISTGSQSFGGYYRYLSEHSKFRNSGSEWIDDQSPMNRTIQQHITSSGHLASAYYDGTFNDKLHIHFDGEYRHSTPFTRSLTAYQDSDIKPVGSTQHRKSTLWAGKLYMDYPLWDGTFTIGTQDSHTVTSLDYRMLNDEVATYIPSSFTNVRQTSLALFVSWNRQFGKFNLSTGARYEYVDYNLWLDGIKNDDICRKDNMLTPDLSISYNFNDKSSVSLSYKTTTVRPPYSQLTSGLTYVGRHEIEGGNPTLRDERMHHFQLFGMCKEFMLQTTFMRSIDTYAFAKRIYQASTPQLLLNPINIDVSSLHTYIVWEHNISNWNPSVTAGVSTQWLNLDGNQYNKPIIMYDFSNILRLPYGFIITVNISGQSGGDIHTNRFRASWFTMDMSLRKSILNNNLSVKLSAYDIFNTANYDWSMNTYGVSMQKSPKYDKRAVTLTLTYKFQPMKSKYKGEDAAAAESNRL